MIVTAAPWQPLHDHAPEGQACDGVTPNDKSKRSATAERNTSANVSHRLHINGCLDVANYPAVQAFTKST
jgi:hypothetical protein